MDALHARLDARPLSPNRPTDDTAAKYTKLDERNIKLEDFTGICSPEEYLEWERQVDKLADIKELLKPKRRRQDKPKINTWSQLRKKMRDKYVPYDFDQHNYLRLTSLFSGTYDCLRVYCRI